MASLESSNGDKSATGKSKSWIGKNLTGPLVDDFCDVSEETLGSILSAPIRVPIHYGHVAVESVIGGVGRAVFNLIPGVNVKKN